MSMFPMENIKKVPWLWLKLNDHQTFCIDLNPDHENQDQDQEEQKPENREADQEEQVEISDIVSALNQNPHILRSIVSALNGRIQDLKLNPPKDEKNKGIDDSSSFTPTPPPRPRKNFHKGESSTTVCVICNNNSVDARGSGEGVVFTVQCGHIYCKDCFVTHLIKKIQEDVFNVKCPVSKCKTWFSPNDARLLLPEQMFERWIECLTLSSVLAKPVYIECPFEWCGKRFVDDGRGFLIRACPSCWRLFCVDCKVGWYWHMGKSCVQYKLEVALEMQRSRLRRRRRGEGGGGDSDFGGRRIIFISDE